MKVLIGVDGSAGARAALCQVGQWLSPERDQVALYYAPPQLKVRAAAGAPSDLPERARQALAEAIFDEARTALPEGLAQGATTITGSRRPDDGLLVAADEWRAELIVVGARGLSPLARLLVGSVSRSVASMATIPVLVVRPNLRHKPGGLNLLLACDGKSESHHAAGVLARFTWPEHTRGRVMHVLESPLTGEIPEWLDKLAHQTDAEVLAHAWATEHDHERLARRAEMTRFCGELPAPFHDQPPLVVEGQPADRILAAVESERIDLVIVGAYGRTLLGRWLISSTSEKVLDHAPCSVLLVPHHAHP